MTSIGRLWLCGREIPGATVAIVDGGIAVGRRTGVSHYIADAAEITDGESTILAARWLCGGSAVDAAMADSETVACVNCRLAAVVPQSPCVYYAWGEDDELLYVGSTTQAPVRIRAHARGTEWWGAVRRLTFDEYPTEIQARQAEADAIRSRPGVHNKASWSGVVDSGSALLGLVEGGESA